MHLVREKKLKNSKRLDVEEILFSGEKEKLLTTEMLEQYINDQKSKNINNLYITKTKGFIEKLINECNWKYIDDITLPSFTEWRAKQKNYQPEPLMNI